MQRWLRAAVLPSLVMLLCACHGTQGQDEQSRPTSVISSVSGESTGPVHYGRDQLQTITKGLWLGGPEPVSGKLRSGISTYYQMTANPQGYLTLLLRFEDVVANDATVQIRTSDGARVLNSVADQIWPLRPNETSKWALELALPLGDSYLHVMTAQRGRHSTRSILLYRAGGVTQPRGATEGTLERDAKGEPIVRQLPAPAPAN